MRILSATGGLAYTNCFLVIDEETRKAVLFDAPDHTVGPLLDTVQRDRLDLVGLWLTHGHFDHLADHATVRERFPAAQTLIHRLDEPKLTKPGSMMFQLPFIIPPGKADGYVDESSQLSIGKINVRVLFTPGHSPGHVSFLLNDEVLIGGDLIIGGSDGRTDLPDASIDDLVASVKKVMSLPGSTKLLGGHGGPSTLDQERRTNEVVQQILAM